MFDRHYQVWPPGLPHHLEIPERNLYENLRLTADAKPDKPAIHYYGGQLTFRELKAQVDRLAGWLSTQGLTKGDRVMLFMQNCPQYVIAYYATLRANGVVVPVNPMNRGKELAHLIEDTGAKMAFAGQELLAEIAPALSTSGLKHLVVAAYADMADPSFEIPMPKGLHDTSPQGYDIPGVTRWQDALTTDIAPPPLTVGPDDLALIPYTSGSSGRQKGCMHTHRTVMVTLVGGMTWIPDALGSASLAVLPLYHVTGMQNSMNGPIYWGETMVIMSRWDRRVAADLISRYKVARWRSISTMAIDLVNDPDLPSYDLSSLKVIGGGGAAMPEPVARKLKEITGLDYIEGYGMSETMAPTHINPVHKPRLQCLGIPIFDVDARIIDPDTRAELGPEEPGEIIVNAPQNFLGYWNDPEATKAAFIELDGKPFLRTGDIGRYDDEGYFYIVDRMKRMVNTGGFKVWPTEVEAMIHDHPHVAEVCIVGQPDTRRGETVRAYVVKKGELTEDELINWCRANMAAYKVPKRVVFLDALPRSPSGKMLWLELQDHARTT